MRKASTFLAATAATLALGWLVACGSSSNGSNSGGHDAATSDAPAPHPDGGGQDAPTGTDASDGGGGDGSVACGSDEAGTALAPFTCCVMGLIDNHTNATDTPDPGFCNNLQDNETDPGQFGKYF